MTQFFSRQNIRVIGLIAIIVVVSMALRLYRLNESGFWADELFTAIFSAPDNSLSEVVGRPLGTPLPTPPLWFIITHYVQKLFGVSETIVRSPAIVAGLLGIPAIAAFGAVYFNRAVGIIAAILLAVSPFHILFSREARFYPAIMLLSVVTYICIYQGVKSNQRKWWVAFTLASLFNLYIHLTAFFVLAAEIVFVSVVMLADSWKNDVGLRKYITSGFRPAFFISLFTMALAYLPMLPFLIKGAIGERGLGNSGEIIGFEFTIAFFLDLFGSFSAGRGLSLSVFVGAALLGIIFAYRHSRRKSLFGLFIIATPLIIIALLRPKHWFALKYVIFMLPIYLVWVAIGIDYLATSFSTTLDSFKSWRFYRESSLVFLVGVFVYFSLLQLPVAYDTRNDKWEKMSQFLSANVHQDDAVVVLPLEIVTMQADEMIGYYEPQPGGVSLLLEDDLDSVVALMEMHRRVWIVTDRRTDLLQTAEVFSWLDFQPQVRLAVAPSTEVIYIGKEVTNLDLLAEVESFNINNSRVYGSLGYAYKEEGLGEQSLAAYKNAITLSPDDGYWHFQLAVLLDELDRVAEAEDSYLAAIEADPRVARYYAEVAAFYSRQGKLENAINYYEEAIRVWNTQVIGQDQTQLIAIWNQQILQLEANLID